MKELSNLQNKNMMNLTVLDISGTKVTSECFDHLNTLGLKELCLNACYGIVSLTNLNIPILEHLEIRKVLVDENEIKNMLRKHTNLIYLDLSENKNITTGTLKNIKDFQLNKLKTLRIFRSHLEEKDFNEHLSDMITSGLKFYC